jgi:hypothetical protein
MSRLQIKVNVAGSWANLVSVEPAQLANAKAACVQLADAHGGPIAFKVIGADGQALAMLKRNHLSDNGGHDWRQLS